MLYPSGRINPDEATNVRVLGTGWNADEQVIIQLIYSDGSASILETPKANTGGMFDQSVDLDALPEGLYTIKAAGAGNKAASTALLAEEKQ